MVEVRAIGMVIYTYAVLEDRLEDLWNWFKLVEKWSGQTYAEYGFTPRDRRALRVCKVSSRNRTKLYQRLQVEQPWSLLDFGWPSGLLSNLSSKTIGLEVAMKSRAQPWRGGERYRSPSYLSLIVSPEVLTQGDKGIAGFLELGIQAWHIIEGIYGFVDVDTGVPLQDDLIRNFDHQLSNMVPKEHFQEFREWQKLMPKLDKRVWKAFWGNFLGAEHLRQLGGIQEMHRSDHLYRLLPEYLQQSYQQGTEQLQICDCYHEWRELDHTGLLLTLSTSPLDWFESDVQEKQTKLHKAFGRLVLSAEQGVG